MESKTGTLQISEILQKLAYSHVVSLCFLLMTYVMLYPSLCFSTTSDLVRCRFSLFLHFLFIYLSLNELREASHSASTSKLVIVAVFFLGIIRFCIWVYFLEILRIVIWCLHYFSNGLSMLSKSSIQL